jgi:hypothetical protein
MEQAGIPEYFVSGYISQVPAELDVHLHPPRCTLDIISGLLVFFELLEDFSDD